MIYCILFSTDGEYDVVSLMEYDTQEAYQKAVDFYEVYDDGASHCLSKVTLEIYNSYREVSNTAMVDKYRVDTKNNPEKEKALELVDKYSHIVYPYCGSGMLTNTVDDEIVLMNSKKGASIVCHEIIERYKNHYEYSDVMAVQFWGKVLEEIEKLTVDDI